MNRICVARGITQKIAQYHNCSVQQVRAALRGAVSSPLAITIRDTAKRWGYKEVTARPAYHLPTSSIPTL